MAILGNGLLLEIKGVEKEYPVPSLNPFKPARKFKALKGIDLNIPKGSICCVLGPNGAGKTTLIKILADLVLPDKGEIHSLEKRIAGDAGLVTPNDRSFYWRLTGRQNLDFFAALCNIEDPEREIDNVLNEVGLLEDADKPYRQYSAGMKQKLNIARALLSNPSLYLLDEPANHLDPLAREEFRNFIKEILVEKRGATVFLCTHDLEEASELADYIALLHEGKIIAQGDPQILKQTVQKKSGYRIRYDQIPDEWHLKYKDLMGNCSDDQVIIQAEEDQIQEILAQFLQQGGILKSFNKEEPELMDIMKHFIGAENE